MVIPHHDLDGIAGDAGTVLQEWVGVGKVRPLSHFDVLSV
jgi:hypothetical protein